MINKPARKIHLKSAAANNILQELQHPILVLSDSLWFHHRNLLNFSLQDQETVVIQINAAASEKGRDLFVGHFAVIDLNNE